MANADTASPTLAARKPTRTRAYCKVTVAGRDVTSVIEPLLIRVVIQKGKLGLPTATIELDDKYGIAPIPQGTEAINITLGWRGEEQAHIVFKGTVTDYESYAQKKSGRRLSIVARGISDFGAGKEPRNDSWTDEGGVTVETAVTDAGKKAGFEVKIAPEIGSKKRPAIMQGGESFINFATRIARESGGIANFDGSKVEIIAADSFKDEAGVVARVGVNVIAWRIKPMAGRFSWTTTSAHYFDPRKAIYIRKALDVARSAFGFGGKGATFEAPTATGDASHAEAQSYGDAAAVMSRRGEGWIVINGEPRAQPLGPCDVAGTRPGVDGRYRISELTHEYSRQGFTTRLDIDQPGNSVALGPAGGFGASP